MESAYHKASISLAAAIKMVEAAQKKALELGVNISVSIVDESGILKMFSRMDNSPLISVTTSLKKAKTAIGFGISTGEDWYNFIKDDPILFSGIQQMDDFILLGGGMPIKIENEIIGAIGISGGHYKIDEQCVLAALKTLEEN